MSSCNVPVIFVEFLIKLESSQQILGGGGAELKYKISSKSVQWSPSCSTQTDGHDEANNLFSQFCELAEKKMPLATKD
jgi:hypothetical protein